MQGESSIIWEGMSKPRRNGVSDPCGKQRGEEWGRENVSCGGISKELVEVSRDDILDEGGSGIKGEDLGNYRCRVWGKRRKMENM